MKKLRYNIKKWFLKRKLKKFFKKLNWSHDDIMGMTSHCGSLDDATKHLTYRLLQKFLCDEREEKILHMTAKVLVRDGFIRGWK